MLLTCMQCGKCCIEYGSDIIAAKEDIERWLDECNIEILKQLRVPAFTGNEAMWLRGDQLLQEQRLTRFNSGELWFNGKGDRLTRCPWFDIEINKCIIHHTKPAICRSYYCGAPP